MGKLKQALIEFEEQRFSKTGEQIDDSNAPSPSWEKEFNDWLDRYEQSFGTREDLS
jgi:hypothetical protein